MGKRPAVVRMLFYFFGGQHIEDPRIRRVLKKPYADIDIGNITVRFQTRALCDHRGIGRYSRDLYRELRKLERTESSGEKGKRTIVHFFPSVHWLPGHLPGNSVIVIHDLIPLVLSDVFPSGVEDWLGPGGYGAKVSEASHVIAISRSTAAHVSSYLGYPGTKMSVVENGVSALPADAAPVDTSRYGEFVVAVGGGDRHKNLSVVLAALRELPDVSLVCVGDAGTVEYQAKEYGVHGRVFCRGRQSDAELAALLDASIGLVFPSLLEGFGLPPLEAGKRGIPSVCSDRPAMNEILADAALFAEPHAPDQWVEAIDLLRDKGRRREMGMAAREYADRYSWQACAQGIVSVLAMHAS